MCKIRPTLELWYRSEVLSGMNCVQHYICPKSMTGMFFPTVTKAVVSLSSALRRDGQEDFNKNMHSASRALWNMYRWLEAGD